MTLELNIFNTCKQPRDEEDFHEVKNLFKTNLTKHVFQIH